MNTDLILQLLTAIAGSPTALLLVAVFAFMRGWVVWGWQESERRTALMGMVLPQPPPQPAKAQSGLSDLQEPFEWPANSLWPDPCASLTTQLRGIEEFERREQSAEDPVLSPNRLRVHNEAPPVAVPVPPPVQRARTVACPGCGRTSSVAQMGGGHCSCIGCGADFRERESPCVTVHAGPARIYPNPDVKAPPMVDVTVG